MFTPYERRQLRLIEEWFEQDDPQLARTLRSGPVKRPSAVPQSIILAVAGSLGLLGIITGVFVLIFSAMIAAIIAGCVIAARRKD
ncbi:DUF3040 domain-containing protein [Kibdelosporangium philippinense]|uniref:DUF3040 domain-containing protein n=1 Tax=Kibdelosporangium philippinense TaxID=211113 RepID=A0ABS8Z0G8_9PSEU|nr:DUF3040 domain-containing protein [Kibdelosporangium philippinense]MCE7001461.1 DUF3040 domain-containing protein [Kibdelosporangium philippinense]